MNRRKFFKGAAGAVAGMFVLDGGKRNAKAAVRQAGRTIDFHAHCQIAGIREMMGGTTQADSPLTIGPDRLRAMDQMGIDLEVLSINPFWYAVDEGLAGRLIRAQNEGIADLCAAYDDRFVGLATVALQHPDLAAEQLEEGVKNLGLRGGSIGSSVGGEELASSRFDPFWAKAEELDVPIFLHPVGIPELRGWLEGNGMLTNVIGNPLATTIALSHLIFEGTLDRFPGLKICSAHGGGYLPAYSGRSDYGCGTRPQQCTRTIEKLPSEYLKQLTFDSVVFTGEALRHLVAVAGSSQIVIGTDYPYSWTFAPSDTMLPRFLPVDHVLGTPDLSDADRAAILGGNAARLLKIPA